MPNRPLRLIPLLLAGGALLFAGCDNSDPVPAADNTLRLVASPASLTLAGATTGQSSLIATVTDKNGAPVRNIGVRFSTTSGSLASNSQNVSTNANGEATDTLTTGATATVTATAGTLTATASVTVNNPNPPPVAAIEITPPTQQLRGIGVTFSGANSTSASAAQCPGSNNGIVQYQWTLSSTNPDPGTPNPRVLTSATPTTAVTFSQAQSLGVTLLATDCLGASGSASTSYAIVANVAPVANAGPSIVGTVSRLGNPYTCTAALSGCASSDSNGTIVTYQWAPGDNSAPKFISTGCTAQHVYGAAGTYTVTLTVHDNGDGSCGPVTETSPSCASRLSATATTTVTCGPQT